MSKEQIPIESFIGSRLTGLHPWNERGDIDAAGLESWVQGRLARQRQQIDALLAVEGQKTLENTLRPYDDAVATLSAAGSLASLLDSVYPDKAVRDKARELTQAVAEAATALSLNQEVYRALAAIDMSSADPGDHALREPDALELPPGRRR